MREIKFRYWDKENSEMISGDVLAFEEYLPIADHLNREGIMRYTGMKDANGVEIYEGDIINFHHSQGKEMSVFNAEVIWKQEWCGFYFKDNYRLNSNMRIEVIGNIYEDSEERDKRIEEVAKRVVKRNGPGLKRLSED